MEESSLVKVPIEDKKVLEGNLEIPDKAKGVVLFAHGSGSSRKSPRNQFVAKVLREGGIGTLLIDLLTVEEEREEALTGYLRFDIALLTKRLIKITDWLEKNPFKIGYFGASTGAAAALAAATLKKGSVKAVVSRGGRPDLAASFLPQVEAPTLLIVGGNDFPVIEMNQSAFDQLTCEKKMVIVPHATHLFEEKGALEEVARLARAWFTKYL